MGEDCLSAKGVQWVRLLLNSPDVPAASLPRPVSAGDTQIEVGNNCPLEASGSQYVDIFNTHTQANNPQFCSDAALGDKAAEFSLSALVGIPGVAAAALVTAAQANWHCFTKTEPEVRAQQLKEINKFIEETTADRKDRPSLLFGDFNIGGVGPEQTDFEEYSAVLNTLRVGPTTQPDLVWPPSDSVNPWKDAFDWDIDHGDVVRQRSDFNTENLTSNQYNEPYSGQQITGTYIGGGNEDDALFLEEKKQRIVSGQPWMGNYRGNERFDYALVRPAYAWDDPNYETPTWAVGTPTQGDLWASPWPGLPGQEAFGRAPSRLSDHKPVVVNLELLPMGYSSSYHPTWKHDWSVRMTVANLSSVEDCYDDPDPRPTLYGVRRKLDGSLDEFPEVTGSECTNTTSAIWPANTCTNNWLVASPTPQDPAVDWYHSGGARVFEIDSICGSDDVVSIVSGGGKPYTHLFWNFGTPPFGLLSFTDEDLTPWASNWPLADNEPITRCPNGGEATVCLRTSFPELAPGQQLKEESP